MAEIKQIKKYSEMTFEEFLTDILHLTLEEPQLYMIRMFEEIRVKKVEYINNWIPNTDDIIGTFKREHLDPVKITYTDDSKIGNRNGEIKY